VKSLWKAVFAKNRYYHDAIYRGIVLFGLPDWLKVNDLDKQKEDAIKARLKKMPELEVAIQENLVVKPHKVEIVPEGK
jgi:hypothetical protein